MLLRAPCNPREESPTAQAHRLPGTQPRGTNGSSAFLVLVVDCLLSLPAQGMSREPGKLLVSPRPPSSGLGDAPASVPIPRSPTAAALPVCLARWRLVRNDCLQSRSTTANGGHATVAPSGSVSYVPQRTDRHRSPARQERRGGRNRPAGQGRPGSVYHHGMRRRHFSFSGTGWRLPGFDARTRGRSASTIRGRVCARASCDETGAEASLLLARLPGRVPRRPARL